jgi:hypothetical protein
MLGISERNRFYFKIGTLSRDSNFAQGCHHFNYDLPFFFIYLAGGSVMAPTQVSKLSLGSKAISKSDKQLPISSFFDKKKKPKDPEDFIDISDPSSDEDEVSFMGCSSISNRPFKALSKTCRLTLYVFLRIRSLDFKNLIICHTKSVEGCYDDNAVAHLAFSK